MTYGLDKHEEEGLRSLKAGDWIRLFVEQGILYARVKKLGDEGLDLDVQLKDTVTQDFHTYEGFFSYPMIKGFVKATKEEVKRFTESQPFWKRYLANYVRIGVNSGENRDGRLTEIVENGIILDPFVKSKHDSLELCNGSLYVSGGDIKSIMPYSSEEIDEDIERINKEMKEKKEEKK